MLERSVAIKDASLHIAIGAVVGDLPRQLFAIQPLGSLGTVTGFVGCMTDIQFDTGAAGHIAPPVHQGGVIALLVADLPVDLRSNIVQPALLYLFAGIGIVVVVGLHPG